MLRLCGLLQVGVPAKWPNIGSRKQHRTVIEAEGRIKVTASHVRYRAGNISKRVHDSNIVTMKRIHKKSSIVYRIALI